MPGKYLEVIFFLFLVYLNWKMSTTEKLIYPRVPGNNVCSCPILQTYKCKTDKMDINHNLFTQLPTYLHCQHF